MRGQFFVEDEMLLGNGGNGSSSSQAGPPPKTSGGSRRKQTVPQKVSSQPPLPPLSTLVDSIGGGDTSDSSDPNLVIDIGSPTKTEPEKSAIKTPMASPSKPMPLFTPPKKRMTQIRESVEAEADLDTDDDKLTEKAKRYRVRQKQCSKFSNEKSLVFLTVNLVEILHVSSYDIYNYIYKVKKIAAACARPPAAVAWG